MENNWYTFYHVDYVDCREWNHSCSLWRVNTESWVGPSITVRLIDLIIYHHLHCLYHILWFPPLFMSKSLARLIPLLMKWFSYLDTSSAHSRRTLCLWLYWWDFILLSFESKIYWGELHSWRIWMLVNNGALVLCYSLQCYVVYLSFYFVETNNCCWFEFPNSESWWLKSIQKCLSYSVNDESYYIC
jgi:hypothetical protein